MKLLQPAQIKPFAERGPNTVDNGLLLRSDLHTLFDLGYPTVTDKYLVEVSQQIRSKFENGREYYRYDGHPLAEPPEHFNERLSSEFLEWHCDNRFVG